MALQPARLWKLHTALLELARRGRASSQLLEIVVGRCTWACMLARPALAVLDETYRFIKAKAGHARLLPKAVLVELRHAAGILPLLVANLTSQWHETITASDASPVGCGVCRRSVYGAALLLQW